jgi:hypothetical protein
MNLATREDIKLWKKEMINELKYLINGGVLQPKKWIKSNEVKKILACSSGTLQNLRLNGTIEFTKIGGTLYYSADSINETLENNKINAA